MHSGMRQGAGHVQSRWQEGLITVFIFLQMCVYVGGQLAQEKSHPPIGKI